MPELPEVETIKNDLRELVLGKTVLAVDLRDPRLARHPSPEQFINGLAGRRLAEIDRRAKYLLIRLDSGLYFVVQLAVTGQLLLLARAAPLRGATRLVLDLDDGRQLRLVDTSRWARVHLLTEAELHTHLPLDELGPEAVSDALTLEEFKRRLGGRSRQIKALLLDQRVISGVGNIYVDEALFAARLHPTRHAASLTAHEMERLYHSLREIMAEAIRLRGTSTRSYRDVRGRKGGYQERLRVVLREGKRCPGADCGGRVVRTIIGGKETFLCPSCQKAA